MTRADDRVREAMARLSCRRDRLCFASQATIAKAAGCHPRTVIRAQQRLAAAGVIVERPNVLPSGRVIRRCRVWGFGQVRRLSHDCPSGRSSRTFKTTTPFGCGARARPRRGRRRRLMENNPAPMGQLRLVRASGEETPFNAGDAVAATVDKCGGVVVGQIRARVGKHAKELLDDGVPPEVVVAACVMGVRAARPHLIPSFAQEILNAKGGHVIDWGEYRNAIRRLNAENKPKTAVDRAFDKMREGKIR